MTTESALRKSLYLFVGLSMLISWSIFPVGPKNEPVIIAAWALLATNKDSIGALSQIFGAIGIVVAAAAFLKTQKLNQATAVFQMMKEARDIRLKIYLLPEGEVPLERQVQIGINLYASMFYYRHHAFVDRVTWGPFEDDLREMLRHPELANWLAGSRSGLGLPPISKYDPRFVKYLQSLHRTTE